MLSLSNLPCQPTKTVRYLIGFSWDVVKTEVIGHEFANHMLYSLVLYVPLVLLKNPFDSVGICIYIDFIGPIEIICIGVYSEF